MISIKYLTLSFKALTTDSSYKVDVDSLVFMIFILSGLDGDLGVV